MQFSRKFCQNLLHTANSMALTQLIVICKKQNKKEIICCPLLVFEQEVPPPRDRCSRSAPPQPLLPMPASLLSRALAPIPSPLSGEDCRPPQTLLPRAAMSMPAPAMAQILEEEEEGEGYKVLYIGFADRFGHLRDRGEGILRSKAHVEVEHQRHNAH